MIDSLEKAYRNLVPKREFELCKSIKFYSRKQKKNNEIKIRLKLIRNDGFVCDLLDDQR